MLQIFADICFLTNLYMQWNNKLILASAFWVLGFSVVQGSSAWVDCMFAHLGLAGVSLSFPFGLLVWVALEHGSSAWADCVLMIVELYSLCEAWSLYVMLTILKACFSLLAVCHFFPLSLCCYCYSYYWFTFGVCFSMCIWDFTLRSTKLLFLITSKSSLYSLNLFKISIKGVQSPSPLRVLWKRPFREWLYHETGADSNFFWRNIIIYRHKDDFCTLFWADSIFLFFCLSVYEVTLPNQLWTMLPS